MDIDGVVIRGPDVIPGSRDAVRMLREANVPYMFMTNGGGVTEAKKAKQISRWLEDDSINESHVVLSHSPYKSLAEKYRGRRVVIVGGAETLSVAESYGFDVRGGMAITPAQIASATHGLHPPVLGQCPSDQPSAVDLGGLPGIDANAEGEPAIEAVLVFCEPKDWWTELQVLTDVIAGGRPLGSGSQGSWPAPQAAEVYVSNPDFLWQSGYPLPRYGLGAFTECLRALWRRTTGEELQVTEIGKPHALNFDFARRLIEANAGTPLQRLYMVGDNPQTDIRGANRAAGAWRSVLTCTGVYRGGPEGNDAFDPGWRVEKDLSAAVQRLLSASDEEHMSW